MGVPTFISQAGSGGWGWLGWGDEGGGGMSIFCHAKSAIKKFSPISNFSFLGGGGTLNFGHTKSTIKCFCQISNFSFQVGYVKLWSCQICHKKIFTRFPIFHSRGGGTSIFGHAKSAIKTFLPDFQLFISQRGYVKLWSWQICHKIFFARFPIFHLGGVHQSLGHAKSAIKYFSLDFQLFISGGGGGMLNFCHAKSAIKSFSPISNISFLGGGGYTELWSCQIYHKKFFCQISNFSFQGEYVKLWSCQICHKNFFIRFPICHSGGGHQPEQKCHLDLKLEKF